MLSPDLIDHLKGLIVSHNGDDDRAFRLRSEAIIRSLITQNRPGEAKALKDALRKTRKQREQGKSGQNPPIFKHGIVSSNTARSDGLITFSSPSCSKLLFFHLKTQSALDLVIRENQAARMLAEAGLSPKSRLLFWGPPGCGKTAAAQMLASSLNVPFGVVRLGSLITSFVGETGANLQKVLKTAQENQMVLLLDEADAIAKTRDDDNDVGEVRRVVNSLLQGLDGFGDNGSIVILASNHSNLFDDAVWRRFDDIISFNMPTKRERLMLLKHLTSGLKLRGSLDPLASDLSGMSFAEIEKAVLAVAKETVLTQKKLTYTKDISLMAQDWRSKTSAAAKGVKARPRMT